MATRRLAISWPANLLGGLSWRPRDWRSAILTGTACVLGVTAFIVLLDAALFRRSLATSYVEFFTAPLWPRTILTCLRALGEEIEFRLVLMTALVAAPALFHRRATAHWIIAAIIVAQFVNVWPFVLAEPLYATLRYWLVGCVWGWLYWKRGWVTAATAHGAGHIVLDPILLLALR